MTILAADLFNPATLRDAYRLAKLQVHVIDHERVTPAIIASAVTFMTACEAADVDPMETLELLQEVYERGSLDVDDQTVFEFAIGLH